MLTHHLLLASTLTHLLLPLHILESGHLSVLDDDTRTLLVALAFLLFRDLVEAARQVALEEASRTRSIVAGIN